MAICKIFRYCTHTHIQALMFYLFIFFESRVREESGLKLNQGEREREEGGRETERERSYICRFTLQIARMAKLQLSQVEVMSLELSGGLP